MNDIVAVSGVKAKNTGISISNRFDGVRHLNAVKLSEKYLLIDGARCSRCQKPTKAMLLHDTADGIIYGYVCGGGHVSRVVYFAAVPDVNWFEGFLRNQLGDRIRSKDLRKATRHGWELGGDAEKEMSASVAQFYWTFYPQNEEERKYATSLCSKEKGCGRLFTQSISENSIICPDCSKRVRSD